MYSAVIASVARMISIHNASYSDDSTYAGTFISLWKVLETTFGVICGCLPAVKPVLIPLFPKGFLGSSDQSRSQYRSKDFSRLGHSGISQSQAHVEVDLEDVQKDPYSGITVNTMTSVISKPKGDSDSEEWIIGRDVVK